MQRDEQFVNDDILNGFMDYSARPTAATRPPDLLRHQQDGKSRRHVCRRRRVSLARPPASGAADSGAFEAPSVHLRLGLP